MTRTRIMPKARTRSHPRPKTPGRSKYHAQRAGGYPSKLEAQRAFELKALANAGQIFNLQEQVKVTLTPHVHWKVDFGYELPTGETVFEEAKGVETEGYRVKKNLWKSHGPAILRIMKRAPAGRITCVEEVIPEKTPT